MEAISPRLAACTNGVSPDPSCAFNIFSYLGRICVDICFDKSLYNLEVSSLECQSERGAPLCVFDVQVGTCLGQGSSNLNVTVQSRPRQSCPAGITPRIYIGSGVNQRKHGTDIVLFNRIVQRCSCASPAFTSLVSGPPEPRSLSGENRPHSKQPT